MNNKNENNADNESKLNWDRVYRVGLGIGFSMLFVYHVLSPEPVSNVTIKDVNKDGLEDVITYNKNNKILGTYLGVRDSSKNITYVLAESLYRQKLDSLEKKHDENIITTMSKYNQDKLNLEKEIQKYK